MRNTARGEFGDPDPGKPKRHLVRLPIVAGPLRGARWIPASGGKILRVLFGSYEPEQTALFAAHLGPGDVLFDVGAHVGYYTLLGARLVGDRGRVLAFEPDPRNASFLRGHVRVNRAANVTVIQAAAGDTEGSVRFAAGTGSGTGHVSEAGGMEVRICRLDDVAAAQDALPTHLKIDVEGAELDVLKGAKQTLAAARPTIFLSTHGAAVHADCCGLLAECGYHLKPILGDDLETAREILCLPPSAGRSAAA